VLEAALLRRRASCVTAGDHVAVPAQDRVGTHQQTATQRAATATSCTHCDGAPMVLGCSAPEHHDRHRTSTRTSLRPLAESEFGSLSLPHAVDQPEHKAASGHQQTSNSRRELPLRNCKEHMSGSDYGSEGWGFESLRARNEIKAVTSGNAGRGLESFPTCAGIFHDVGPWCSDGAPMSMCCPSGGPCRYVLTSADGCFIVWIMAEVPVDDLSIIIHRGHRCGSSRRVTAGRAS
jgi:hypothetical protein